MAMGCCRWKSGECLKSLSGNSCPKVEDPKPPLCCDDDDTCCYFSCDVMKLDPGPQITQKGNCGADCTVAVLPDYRGNKFPELFLIPDGYYTGENYYAYGDGPMDVQGTNTNMFDRCKNTCFGAPRENPTAMFLFDYKRSNDFVKKRSCAWLETRPEPSKEKICVKRNLSTRGLSPAAVVCPVTCAPYL